MKIINCKHCNKEFKVSNKNTRYKFCCVCRKDKKLLHSLYRTNNKNAQKDINSSLKHLEITFTGGIGYRIKLLKYKKIGLKKKETTNKYIYLEFIEELEKQLQEEKENILKW